MKQRLLKKLFSVAYTLRAKNDVFVTADNLNILCQRNSIFLGTYVLVYTNETIFTKSFSL